MADAVGSDEALEAAAPRNEDRRLAALVLQLVAATFGMEPERIMTGGREPRPAMARLVAMYLAHTGLDWTMRRTGAAFGRDKSSVSAACRRVEDLREDPVCDVGLGKLERWLRTLDADRVRL